MTLCESLNGNIKREFKTGASIGKLPQHPSSLQDRDYSIRCHVAPPTGGKVNNTDY